MVNAISTPDQNTLKVAVVVPTYNESETLPQLIEKVVAGKLDIKDINEALFSQMLHTKNITDPAKP